MDNKDFRVIKELCSIRDFLRWSVSRFYENDIYLGHGTDEPWDEAVALILYALHLPHMVDDRILDAKLTKIEKERILMLVNERIEKRIPTPYLTHEAYFLGMSFYVDDRVLIPRSPIAELIEHKFSPWIKEDEVNKILDIGTGCGCIAVGCAAYFPNAKITALDISRDALAVAEHNLKRHHCEDQISLIHSDLFEALPNQAFDIIVSNPPYVPAGEIASLPQEYYHEPQIALLAADDGLSLVIRLLQQAKNYLAPHGIIIVEVGNSQAALSQRFPNIPFVWLEFSRGGEGVFLLTAEDINKHHNDFLRG